MAMVAREVSGQRFAAEHRYPSASATGWQRASNGIARKYAHVIGLLRLTECSSTDTSFKPFHLIFAMTSITISKFFIYGTLQNQLSSAETSTCRQSHRPRTPALRSSSCPDILLTPSRRPSRCPPHARMHVRRIDPDTRKLPARLSSPTAPAPRPLVRLQCNAYSPRLHPRPSIATEALSTHR